MIYLDTSIVLAQLLSEDRRPPDPFWENDLISSRLMEYEVWTRLHRDGYISSHGEGARRLIGRVAFAELSRLVLERIVEGFPTGVRTLDAMHLATLLHLREMHQPVQLATYDLKQALAAKELGIPLAKEIG